MARKKKLPFIPVQEYDMGTEFAGKQYLFNDSVNTSHSKRYELFRDNIKRLIMSNFRWYGITEQESNQIERLLNEEGRICAIRSTFNAELRQPDGIYFGRFGSGNNVTYDFYGFPSSCSCTGYNGIELIANSPNDFVIGYDSKAHIRQQQEIKPVYSWIDNLASELDDAYSMWKVAADTRKTGLVFKVRDTRSAKLLKQVLGRKIENESYIVVEGSELENTEIIPTTYNNSVLSDYHMNFMNTWGLVLDLLGLENNSQNKKERLIVTEAEMNRSLSRYIGADRLSARKDFADEVNKKFGTNIKVENYLASVVEENGNDANIYGKQEGNNNEQNDS